MFVQDYILNGLGHGPVGEQLAATRFDTGFHRPYFDKNGRPAVTVNMGKTTLIKGVQTPIKEHYTVKELQDRGVQLPPVVNATSMRKEEWLEVDRTVLKAARFRLSAWADLASFNTFSLNGMGRTVLEHETMSDPGEAVVDMDALTEGRTDSPKFQLQGLPLPITHSDFYFSERRLAISRNSGTPLDTTMAEAAARRVAESVEKTTIGTNAGITYGGNSTQVGGYGRASTVYGYTNFPARLTYTTMTRPTAGGWTASVLLGQILAMRERLYANKFYGPFMIYLSSDWDAYLDGDYILTGGNVATQTLRERIKNISGIAGVKRLDFLFPAAPAASTGPGGEGFTATATSPFTLLMIQMTQDVARAVVGLDLTTIQWDAVGGLRKNWKILAIHVPQIRADWYGNCGILHSTAAA